MLQRIASPPLTRSSMKFICLCTVESNFILPVARSLQTYAPKWTAAAETNSTKKVVSADLKGSLAPAVEKKAPQANTISEKIRVDIEKIRAELEKISARMDVLSYKTEGLVDVRHFFVFSLGTTSDRLICA